VLMGEGFCRRRRLSRQAAARDTHRLLVAKVGADGVDHKGDLECV
jgi:hypothetical protein